MPEQHILLGDEPFLRVLRGKQLSRSILTSLLSLSDSAFRGISERLIALGYVYKPKYKLYALTDKGDTYIERHYLTMRPTFGSKEVKALIKKIPTEAHQALFRLSLSGVVARKYLFYEFKDSWCGGIIGGETTSFKTMLLKLIIRVLRLEPESDYIRKLTITLPLGLLGRRTGKLGGGQTINLDECIELPFLGLDEYQKGDAALKRMVMFFLDGGRETKIEDKTAEHKPFTLVATNLNPQKELDFPDEVIRRTCAVNTKDLGVSPQAYEEAIDSILNNPIPEIPTDNLPVIFRRLEADERKLVRELLYDCIRKDIKKAVFDSNAVNILVLGWLILTGGKNPKIAIFEVCYDRLVTLETLNLTAEGWRERFLARYGKYKGELDPDFEKKRLEIAKREEEIKVTIEEGKEKIEERQHSKEEIRRDLIRAYVKVNTDYKLLIKDLSEAKKFIPEIETGGLLGYIRDDRDQFKSGKKTEDRLERYQRVFNEDKEAAAPYLREAKQKGIDIELGKKSNEEEKVAKGDERANILWELREWRHKINKTGEPYTPAIGKLRDKSHQLSKDISLILKRPSRVSTAALREALRQVKRYADLWLAQYEKDIIDPSAVIVDRVENVVIAGAAKIHKFLTGEEDKGKGGGKPKPPTTPEPPPFNGRPFDDGGDL